ncbi:MAG TPA: phosphoglycerate kinase [Candidatus Doudnabacteria bacterium]|nr:phosphoglycerate kinase [Candidatus Doudnabacteria bacterium]
MSIKQILQDKSLKNKRVILRLDLNESIDKSGKLLNDFRIQAALPTIRQLQKNGNKLIILSHLGRPAGKFEKSLSLEPIAKSLAEKLNYKYVKAEEKLPVYAVKHFILFTGDITKPETRLVLTQQSSRDIILLENIRFYQGEEENSETLASQLAELGDVYVNDAFSVSHRAESSTSAIAKFLPSYAGPLLSKEIAALDILLGSRVKKPFFLLMGGIKITDKAKTLMHLGKRADKILLGGGLANLFLHAKGYDVGHHQLDAVNLRLSKQLMLNLKSKLVFPLDVTVYSPHKRTGSKIVAKPLTDILATDKIYDIGPKTILEYSKILKDAGTVCWNGPLGYFEKKPFRTGTMALAKVIGATGKRRAYAVAGGGETVAAIQLAGQFENFDHVSTGGGAMLEYLSGAKLPGIEALRTIR